MAEGRERLLTEDEVALVFRRAAELEAEEPGDRATFDVATLERIAVEAGLSPAAVRRAVAELQAGRLVPAVEDGRRWWRPVVPPSVVVERRLAVPADAVSRRLESYLRQQTFRVVRRRGELTVWEPNRGLAANLARGVDLSDRLRLRRVDGVEVQVLRDGSHGQHADVRIVLDLTRVRRNAQGGTITGIGFGAVGAVGGATAVVLGVPAALLSEPLFVAMAAGSHFGARSTYAKHVKKAVDAVELVLDELEEGRGR
jgi:hypothetical protein